MTIKIIFFIFITLIGVGAAQPIQAATDDSRASIYGIVTDAETGVPLTGASVVIRGTNLGTSTDIEGRFRLRSVPVGD